MPRYELVTIISPDVAEEDIPGAIEKIAQLISQSKGTVIGVDHWGKRKFAYPIKHHREGDYVVTQFELEANKTGEFQASLKFCEEFLRHLLVKSET
jgi:small subunit ribosomal protein S6